MTRRRYKLKSLIESRALYHAMTVSVAKWDTDALAVDTIAMALQGERFPADQAQIAAQAAWDNTKSQPPL
jgi:hypothetical protein